MSLCVVLNVCMCATLVQVQQRSEEVIGSLELDL